MNDVDEIWVGAVSANGNITKKPLFFVKKNKTFLAETISPEWSFLNSLSIYPGLFFPQRLDCVYFCSYRREDVCAFIAGSQAAYCMTFHKMKSFFGSNSGEYSANSGVSYGSLMQPELEPKEDDEEEFIPF